MSGERKLQHLAKGWCWSTVHQALCNHDHARIPVKAEDRASRSGEYPYYGASGVIDTIDEYLFDGSYLLIGEDGANLLARSKPIAFQAHGRFWVNNHAHVLTTYAGMSIGFFESYFNFIDLAPHITGTAQPKLPQAAMNKIAVPIAPCNEQQRIVEAIESYFTRLDDAVATLERVERNLKRYRTSVLKSAVEGRLVPTEAALAKQEGRDYEPASVLLERIVAERRRRWSESGKKGKYQEPAPPDTTNLPDLPEGWCWASMDQFLVWIEAGKNFRCDERPPISDEIGVVKVSSVSWGRFQEDESKTCTRTELVNDELLIRPNDLLISRANTVELVGACVIVGAVSRKVMLSDKILRLHTAGALESWLLWVLRSCVGRRQIEALATGNQDSMRNIGQKAIASICVPLPPAIECRRIVTEIEAQMSKVEDAELIAQHSLVRCKRLRQSILKWAFEGRLADQDPNDEPASILLERIKAEREPFKPAKMIRSQRSAGKKQVRA